MLTFCTNPQLVLLEFEGQSDFPPLTCCTCRTAAPSAAAPATRHNQPWAGAGTEKLHSLNCLSIRTIHLSSFLLRQQRMTEPVGKGLKSQRSLFSDSECLKTLLTHLHTFDRRHHIIRFSFIQYFSVLLQYKNRN